MKTVFRVGCTILFLAAPALWAEDLQALVDAAGPGSVVEVGPGLYRGPVKLEEGMTLSGAGAGLTVIEGDKAAAVVDAVDGCCLCGLTIRGGSAGVRNNVGRLGVFGCEFVDNAVSAVYAGGGGCILVDNLVRGSGKLGFQLSAVVALVGNNTVVERETAIRVWKAPWSALANNILAYSGVGFGLEEGASPDLFNNDFWANGADTASGEFLPENLYLAPVFADPEGGDYSLSPGSPLLTAGAEADWLPPLLGALVGCDLSLDLDPAQCRELMDRLEREIVAWKGELVYGLGSEPGEFRVLVRQAAPAFRVTSSAAGTAIDRVQAWDDVTDEDLKSSVIESDPAAVEVSGEEGEAYPSDRGRYILDSMFSRPESFFRSDAGALCFRRETNMPLVTVEIPLGWEISREEPEGESVPAGVRYRNPEQKLFAISLDLVPSAE